MKTKCNYRFFTILAIISLVITACSDDDNSIVNNEDANSGQMNQIAVLKQSLLTEEDGKEVLLRGVALDPADPTTVSISVDDYDDAFVRFNELFSEETESSADGMTYTLTDMLSQKAGTVKLVKGNNENGVVAYADFDVPAIPQLSRINYILHSAWPDNAKVKGYHKLGERYEYKGWSGEPTFGSRFDKDEVFKYVCVREYDGGEPALLVSISPKKHYIQWYSSVKYSARIPVKNKALNISKLLQSDWDKYLNYFNKDGDILYRTEYYWINSGIGHGSGGQFRNAIQLYGGKVQSWDVFWSKPEMRVVFFIESKETM